MAKTNINIDTNDDLKRQLKESCSDMDITEIPNAETIKAIEDARNGIGLSKPYSSIEELMKDLNSDD